MAQTKIIEWLGYWRNANMVSINAICAFDQVYEARKYCQCMRVGVFTNVTDLQIWNALKAMRAAEQVAA